MKNCKEKMPQKSPSKKPRAKKGLKSSNPWVRFVTAFERDHPKMSYKKMVSAARKAYKKSSLGSGKKSSKSKSNSKKSSKSKSNSKKSSKSKSGSKKTTNRKSGSNVRKQTVKTHIKKVQLQVHPEMNIAADVLTKLNEFLYRLAKVLIQELNSPTRSNLQSVIEFVFPRMMADYAQSAGTRAVNKYLSSLPTDTPQLRKEVREWTDRQKAPRYSLSARSGLQFPVPFYRNMLPKKAPIETAVYLTAVMEYVTAEIMELSGNATRDEGMKTIKWKYVMTAIANDNELNYLYHI